VLESLFQDVSESDGLTAAVVTEATPALIKAVLADGEAIEVAGDGLKFVARSLGDKAPAATRIRPGAVIRLARDAKGRWEVTQVPAGRVGRSSRFARATAPSTR
jgi:penicillin-binding protein 1A